MKKWTVLCALSLSFALYSGVDAQAQEQEQNVTINTEITGNLASKTDTNTYTFKVEKAGKITLNATSYMTNLRLTIYDSNQKQVDSVSGFTKASATNAVKKIRRCI